MIPGLGEPARGALCDQSICIDSFRTPYRAREPCLLAAVTPQVALTRAEWQVGHKYLSVSLEHRWGQGKKKTNRSHNPEGYWKDLLSPSSVSGSDKSSLRLRLNCISLVYSICKTYVTISRIIAMVRLDARVSYAVFDTASPDICL